MYFKDPIRVDYSPIFIAIKMANVAILEHLCDSHPNLDSFVDSQGHTPLMLAVKFKAHAVTNYLTLRKCDLNQVDPTRKTLLMHYLLHTEELAQGGDTSAQRLSEFARKFISRGADVNFTSQVVEFGQTVLIQAIRMRNHAAIEFLLQNGADPHIADMAGMDACDHAQRHGLAQAYPQLAMCDRSKRKQPLKLPGADGEYTGLQSLNQAPGSKYDAAYKQISAQFHQVPREDEDEIREQANNQITEKQNYQESLQLVKSDQSVEIPRNRTKASRKTMDISMQLAEPISVIDETQRS